jgi:hypothetical protein
LTIPKNGEILQKSLYLFPRLPQKTMPTAPFRYYFEFRQGPTGTAVIEAVYHSEGREAYTAGANPRYEYSIKDHAGGEEGLLILDLELVHQEYHLLLLITPIVIMHLDKSRGVKRQLINFQQALLPGSG